MKIQATGNDSSSPFNRLPDEIVLQILNKLIDLKTLCFCYVVCKRFYSTIHQIDTLSFTTPPIDIDFDDELSSSDAVLACFKCALCRSAVKSMKKFRGLKSLSINLPFPIIEKENHYLFKWKATFGNNKFDSFLIISPNSICYNTNNGNGNGQEQVLKSKIKSYDIMFKCLKDGVSRVRLLFKMIIFFPLLEKVSIIDSAKLGIVSVNSIEQITEIRNWLLSPSETIQQKLKHLRVSLGRISRCYIPLLELPVSRYVMKGVNMVLVEHKNVPDGYNSFTNFDDNEDDFQDNEHHAAYKEAVNEIFNKHKGSILPIWR